MPMHPIFKDKPVWFQCVLLATLITGFLVFTSLLTLGINGTAVHVNSTASVRWEECIDAIGAMLLPCLLFAQLTHADPLGFIGLKPTRTSWFFPVAFLLAFLCIPMVQVLAQWNEQWHLPGIFSGMDKWMRETEDQNDTLINRILAMPRPSDLVSNLIVMALVPALCEEVFFRGIIQKGFIRVTGRPMLGILIGALVFSALHFQFLGFFSRAALGMILGLLYWYSGSLWPGILAHFTYNGVQVVYFYIQQRQSNTHPSPFFDDKAVMPVSYGLISAVIAVAGVLLMKRLSNRSPSIPPQINPE